MDYPTLARGYAQRGINAMLVPAWDFKSDAWAHARPAQLRGIEGGFTVVRSARNGLLSVSDGFGRVLAAEPSVGTGLASLVAAAPIGPPFDTVHNRVGDAFGWLCVAAATGLVALVFMRPRRAASVTDISSDISMR